jgi:hypothetical protein
MEGPNNDGTFWIDYEQLDLIGFQMYNFQVEVPSSYSLKGGGCFMFSLRTEHVL